jgi:drug/metabolite transporter (DMT)-like permease
MPYAGELAALSTALLWSFTAVCFSEAGKQIGSFQVNKIRLVFAVLIYTLVLTLTTGLPWPSGINAHQVFWLALSGVVGLVFGDGCGFKALVMIGPRLMTLVSASAPVVATLVAWFFLGEKLSMLEITGIAVTVGGITWVVSERKYANGNKVHQTHPDAGTLAMGVLLAFGAAVGQAVGLVLSKYGMLEAGGKVPPLQASYIRMVAALAVIWTISAIRGKLGDTMRSMKNGRALAFSGAGAVFGPFLGVWMSLVAVSMISTGVAATLNATTPVLIIPTVMLYYREKVTIRAAMGALVAVIGIAMLFWGS